MKCGIVLMLGMAGTLVFAVVEAGAQARNGSRTLVSFQDDGDKQGQSSGGGGGGGGGNSSSGGVSNSQADCARGMGVLCSGMGAYAEGLGKYNLYTTQAVAIDTTTSVQLNEYLWQCQQVNNRQRFLHQQKKHKLQKAVIDAAQQRLGENPTKADVESGAALNFVYDQITLPRAYRVCLNGAAAVPLDYDVFRQIHFRYASGAITVSLQQLTAQGGWPAVLMDKAFEPDRTGYQKAVEAALNEEADEKALAPGTIQNLRDSVRKLVARMDADLPKGSRTRPTAERFLKSLAGMTQLLEGPDIRKIQEAIRPASKTNLSDLLTFMLLYNLRFGPAETPAHRLAYIGLFGDLAAIRDKALTDTDLKLKTRGPADVDEIQPGLENRAMAAFQKIGWDRLLAVQPTAK